MGTAFEHPWECVLMEKFKQTHGIDIYFCKDFTNFGVIRVSDQVRSDIISQTEALETLLLSSIQSKEVMVGEVESNKYRTPKCPSRSATITVHKINDQIGNIVQERTFLMEEKSLCEDDEYDEYDENSTYKDKVFVIAFEDISENYESGKSQKQLGKIFESFEFI